MSDPIAPVVKQSVDSNYVAPCVQVVRCPFCGQEELHRIGLHQMKEDRRLEWALCWGGSYEVVKTWKVQK